MYRWYPYQHVQRRLIDVAGSCSRVRSLSLTPPGVAPDNLIPCLDSVDLEFRAVSNGGTTYCATSSGCAIYAYYLEVDEDDDEADFDFATTCQAYDGTLAYEDTITTSSDATSAFTTSVCVEFPQKVSVFYGRG